MFVGKVLFALRRLPSKVENVHVRYKLSEILKDIEDRSSERIRLMEAKIDTKIDKLAFENRSSENRSSERIQSMKSDLEAKIDKLDTKIDNLARVIKADISALNERIGQLSGDIGAFNGRIGAYSKQLERQSIIRTVVFSIFFYTICAIFGVIFGITSKIAYDTIEDYMCKKKIECVKK